MSSQTCFVAAPSHFLSKHRGSQGLLPRRLPSHTQHCPVPKRRARALTLPTIVARADTSTELEDAVLESLGALRESAGNAPQHRYRTSQPDKFAATAEAVRALEQSTGGFGGGGLKLRSLLPGTWELVLTDSLAVEKNGGSITGLGSLPGAKCKSVQVELKPDGKARTIEGIEVWFGLMKGENALIGKWKVTGKGGKTLEVTYASASLMGKTTVRADSKAVLDTTYCSERLRVGRSQGGEFYLFIRKQDD